MFDQIFRPFIEKYGTLSVLAGIVVLFALSLVPSTTALTVIKFLFFFALISAAYLRFQLESPGEEEAEENGELPDMAEDDQEWLQIENDQDVEASFEMFLESSLQLVKNILVSDTIVLLFINYSKKMFTIRHRVTSQEEAFISRKSFDLLQGLPSIVLRNRTPLIENHLPEGSEILPYYRSEENPANSFAAVPIYFNDLIIGVLCADSTVEEAYSNDDLEILKKFSRLITTQLLSSNKLYEYESENWVVNTLFEFSQGMNHIQDVASLWEYLSRQIPKFIPCERISISLNDNKEGRIVSLQGGTGNQKTGKKFALTEGIVGWVMRKNQSLLVEDFSSKDNYVPRFFTDETPSRDYFSLLAVPMSNQKNVLGAICLEAKRPRHFKEQQKRILQTIANQAVTVFITARTLDQLKKYNFKDTDTQLENLNAFRSVIPREIKRAAGLKLNLNLLFCKLYFQLKEDDAQLFQDTIAEFLSLILPSVSETDYIFRIFPDSFVIASLEKDEKSLYLFGKQLLQKVKEKKVWANGQAFGFYISLGLLENRFLSGDSDELLEKGEAAVKQARLAGPNSIASYGDAQKSETDLNKNMNLSARS